MRRASSSPEIISIVQPAVERLQRPRVGLVLAQVVTEVAPGVLEDQLAAPLVTKENVDDKSLWGNNL